MKLLFMILQNYTFLKIHTTPRMSPNVNCGLGNNDVSVGPPANKGGSLVGELDSERGRDCIRTLHTSA